MQRRRSPLYGISFLLPENMATLEIVCSINFPICPLINASMAIDTITKRYSLSVGGLKMALSSTELFVDQKRWTSAPKSIMD